MCAGPRPAKSVVARPKADSRLVGRRKVLGGCDDCVARQLQRLLDGLRRAGLEPE